MPDQDPRVPPERSVVVPPVIVAEPKLDILAGKNIKPISNEGKPQPSPPPPPPSSPPKKSE